VKKDQQAYKDKARAIMVGKEIDIEKLRVNINKLEMFLKTKHNLSNNDISLIETVPEESKLDGPFTKSSADNDSMPDSSRLSDLSQSSYLGDLADNTNKEYVKNVFIKYLLYMAGKNHKELRTLEKVLFTILHITKVERD
jgi:hypothetical protein